MKVIMKRYVTYEYRAICQHCGKEMQLVEKGEVNKYECPGQCTTAETKETFPRADYGNEEVDEFIT
jgi:hypothetical protein